MCPEGLGSVETRSALGGHGTAVTVCPVLQPGICPAPRSAWRDEPAVQGGKPTGKRRRQGLSHFLISFGLKFLQSSKRGELGRAHIEFNYSDRFQAFVAVRHQTGNLS